MNRLPLTFFGFRSIQQQCPPTLLKMTMIQSLNQRKFLSTTKSMANSNEKYRFSFTNGANGKITNEQRDFYEENGYILVKKLLTDQDIDRYW